MTPLLISAELEPLVEARGQDGANAFALNPRSSPELVEAWYEAGRSALLPMACTGELVSSRHHAA